MMDLLTALGLMLVLEGAAYALFPEGMKQMTARLSEMPVQHLRLAGIIFAVMGFLIVAVLRGY